jgi:hypothetical protein
MKMQTGRTKRYRKTQSKIEWWIDFKMVQAWWPKPEIGENDKNGYVTFEKLWRIKP